MMFDVYSVVCMRCLVLGTDRWKCLRSISVVFFFFQAEDGIRDLVRSRGLGDVYKRQGKELPLIAAEFKTEENLVRGCQSRVWLTAEPRGAVSYTHLTLPTSDLV